MKKSVKIAIFTTLTGLMVNNLQASAKVSIHFKYALNGISVPAAYDIKAVFIKPDANAITKDLGHVDHSYVRGYTDFTIPRLRHNYLLEAIEFTVNGATLNDIHKKVCTLPNPAALSSLIRTDNQSIQFTIGKHNLRLYHQQGNKYDTIPCSNRSGGDDDSSSDNIENV